MIRALILLLAALAAAPALAQKTPPPSAASADHLPPAPPPTPAPAPFDMPETRTVTLDNGLQATFIPFGMTPTVDIRISVRAGNIDEGEETWLSDLAVDLMAEGFGGRSADEIHARFGEMGGSLSAGVLVDHTTFGAVVLSEYGPEAIDLLAEAVREPDFPEAALTRLRDGRIQTVSIRREQPAVLAYQAAARHQYPPGHPFHNVLPTEAQLRSYTVDRLAAFYRDHFGAARTHVYIAGRFDPDAMEAALRDAFGDWEAGPADRGIDAVPAAGDVVHLIDRPGAPQSTIQLSYTIGSIHEKEAHATEVMDAALGGGIASQMRTMGYSYAPTSTIEWTRGGGVWHYTDDVNTAQTALALQDALTIIEYSRYVATPMDSTKRWMTSLFVMSVGSSAGLIAAVIERDQYGLPASYLDDFVGDVMDVPDEAVVEVAADYLVPANRLLVVVGDLDEIEDGIRAIPHLANATFIRDGAPD